MRQFSRPFGFGIAIVLVNFALLGAASVKADSLGLSIVSSAELKPGMLASIDSGTGSRAVPTTTATCPGLIGAATSQPSSNQDQKFVATTGTASVYVSTLGGDISPGDFIGCSNLVGIGQKVSTGQVVGRAITSLDRTKSIQQTVKNAQGSTVQVQVGQIDIALQVQTIEGSGKSVVPIAFQRFADAIAGHPVAAWRLILAMILIILATGIGVVALTVGIRSALTAIGRNPMAAAQARSGLWQVIFAAVATLLVGYLIAYIVLVG